MPPSLPHLITLDHLTLQALALERTESAVALLSLTASPTAAKKRPKAKDTMATRAEAREKKRLEKFGQQDRISALDKDSMYVQDLRELNVVQLHAALAVRGRVRTEEIAHVRRMARDSILRHHSAPLKSFARGADVSTRRARAFNAALDKYRAETGLIVEEDSFAEEAASYFGETVGGDSSVSAAGSVAMSIFAEVGTKLITEEDMHLDTTMDMVMGQDSRASTAPREHAVGGLGATGTRCRCARWSNFRHRLVFLNRMVEHLLSEY